MGQYKDGLLGTGQGFYGLEEVAGFLFALQLYAGMIKNRLVVQGLLVFIEEHTDEARTFLPCFGTQVVEAFINGDAAYPGGYGRTLIERQY